MFRTTSSTRSALSPFAAALLLLLVSACAGGDRDAEPEPSATASPSPSIRDGEEWIAFQGVSLGLTMLRPDGTGSHVILDELPGDQLHPDWSPDGSQLAFVQESEDGARSEVWLSDPAGADPEPLVDEYPAELAGLLWDNPAWSPDGSQIVMVGYDVDGGELPTRAVLTIVDVATDEVSVAGDYPFAGPYPGVSFPRWAPDGNAMVVAVGRFDERAQYTGEAIAVITRAGDTWAPPTIITPFDEFATRPDWHPTEDLIVFVTRDVGAFQTTDDPSNLFTIRPDGSGTTPVTQFAPAGERASQPSWTWDGRIIFTYIRGTDDMQRDIAIINADGSGLEVVTGEEDVGRGNRPHPRLRPVP